MPLYDTDIWGAISGTLADQTDLQSALDAKVSFPGFTSLAADYSFTDNSGDWNTAFGWGNHASAGYVAIAGTQAVTGAKTFSELLTIGKGVAADGSNNVYLGSVYPASATGSHNITLGFQAGQALTIGNENTLIGKQAGYLLAGSGDGNLIGALNVFVGSDAGGNATTSYANVAIGQKSLNGVTTQGSNIAIGKSACANSLPTNCVVIGKGACEINATAFQQAVYIGNGAGNTTRGDFNVVVGYGAESGTGTSVIAIGHSAGLGIKNLAVGNTVFIGKNCGYSLTGTDNTCVGSDSGGTGSAKANVMIGAFAGYYGHGDGENILIGYASRVPSGTRQTFVAGSSAIASTRPTSILDVYFGSGVTDTTPDSYTIHGTGGEGTDIAGANVTIAGGKGTGTGLGGKVKFQIAGVGSSGTTLNTLDDAGEFTSYGLDIASAVYAENFYSFNQSLHPDAANGERFYTRWVSNRLQIGNEIVGSGTLREVQIIGSNVSIGNITPQSGAGLTVADKIALKVSGTLRGLIGSPAWATNYLSIQNGTLAEAAANAALFQDSSGLTSLNSASGQPVDVKIGNVLKLRFASTGVATFTNKMITRASATSEASVNIPDGVEPTSPVDGDEWRIGDVMYRRIAGVTKSVTFT